MINIFVFGTIIGSFLNGCISSYLSNEPIIFTNRSHCSICHHQLSWLDLCPILSWFWLKGHCRYCHHSISCRYFFVEFLLGVLYVLIFQVFNTSFDTLIYLFLIPFLIWGAFIDLKLMIIPDRIHVVCLICGLLLLILHPINVPNRFIGLFILSVPCFILARFSGGIGYGDVKLLASFGLLLGWQNLLLLFILSSFTASFYGLFNSSRPQIIPFGPHLMFAFFVSLFAGQTIIAGYTALFLTKIA